MGKDKSTHYMGREHKPQNRSACGIWPDYDKYSPHWHEVTCKSCIKNKPRKK